MKWPAAIKPSIPRLRHLPQEQQAELDEHAAQLRASAGKDVIQILDDGDRLQAVKDSLAYGLWLEWLRDKVQIHAKSTVENYMRAAKWRRELLAQGTRVNFTQLSRSSLFSLGRDSTPEAARVRVLDAMVASPLSISHKAVEKIVREERKKEKPDPAPDPDPPPPSPSWGLNAEQLAQISDDLRNQLRINEVLWRGLLKVTAEKGLRVLVGTGYHLLPLIDIPNPYAEPDHPDVPDWARTQPKPRSDPPPQGSEPFGPYYGR